MTVPTHCSMPQSPPSAQRVVTPSLCRRGLAPRQRLDAAAQLQEVLALLEQIVVVSLVRDVLDRGMRVAIGNETGVEPLADCSLVVAPFAVDGISAGTIGVLGPTRMDYSQALSAVAVVSKRPERELNEG